MDGYNRPATVRRSDVYGAFNFGPTTTQLGTATSIVGGAANAATAQVVTVDPAATLAHGLFSSAAGVAIVIVLLLAVFSLTD